MTDAEFEATMTCVDPKPEGCTVTSGPPDATTLATLGIQGDKTGKGVDLTSTRNGVETGTAQASRARENRILAIDPGTTESGWCLFENGEVVNSGVMPNDAMLRYIQTAAVVDFGQGKRFSLAIEMIASYGMAVGREVFETCVWIGRFVQAWHSPDEVSLVYRRDVKLHLCGNPRAKDANIRVALIDLIGPQGTKKSPGPTYGVKSHAWAALGVAVTAAHQMQEGA